MPPYDPFILRTLLVKHEGKKPRLYTDTAGKITGGIGHNFTDKPLSEAAIQFLYQEDVVDVCHELDVYIPWWRGLSAIRQTALIDFVFNVGIEAAMKFKQAMHALQEGNYPEAATQLMTSKWATEVGHRAQDIAHMVQYDSLPA